MSYTTCFLLGRTLANKQTKILELENPGRSWHYLTFRHCWQEFVQPPKPELSCDPASPLLGRSPMSRTHCVRHLLFHLYRNSVHGKQTGDQQECPPTDGLHTVSHQKERNSASCSTMGGTGGRHARRTAGQRNALHLKNYFLPRGKIQQESMAMLHLSAVQCI